MKKTILLLSVSGLMYVSMSSYSSGPSGTPPGVTTAKTGCGNGCHGAQGSNAQMTLTITEDGQSQPVTNGFYKPGVKYTVNFSEQHPGANKFGYIALITDNSDKQAGTLSKQASATDIKITTKGAYMVAEQPSAQDPMGGGISSSFIWQAPGGQGDVTIYLAVNSCNGNGSADGGDTWALKTLTLKEGWPSAIAGIKSDINARIFPNPVSNILNINIPNYIADNYQYNIINVSGAILKKGTIQGKNSSVEISSIPSGMYILNLSNGANSKTIQFNKL